MPNNVIEFASLTQQLSAIKSRGGIINNKIIKHLEVEKLAANFNVQTTIELVDCNLPKSCCVVKAIATYNGNKYESFGEVSPLNNDFNYPVAVAEKRAVDRAVLKALGIHGKYYSDAEMPPQPATQNQGIDVKDHPQIILDRITAASHQANLDEVMSDNKEFLFELGKKNSEKAEQIKKAFENKTEQLKGG
tara:strand:- start:1070 stop:1642 length:573 start_codon:yes stop_codon:yes gene_type:complete